MKHTPQWRLDIKMMVETLELVEAFLCSDGEDEAMWEAETLKAVQLALKLGKQYRA